MLADVLNAGSGLVVGLLTGYVFERRATRQAERENGRLREELRVLREGIYSVGGHRADSMAGPSVPSDLRSQLCKWLEQTQDADGRVLAARALAEFASRGHSSALVDKALDELVDAGEAARDGEWVRVL